MNTDSNEVSTFPISVVLVIVAQETLPDRKHLNKFLVLKDSDTNQFMLPSLFLAEGQTTKSVAEQLLFKYTGVEEFWVPIFNLGLVEGESIEALYYVVMHEPTRIRVDGSVWSTYEDLRKNEDLVTKQTLDVISEAVCRKM